MSGATDFLDDTLGLDDSGGIGGTVKEAGAQIDDFVNAEIPGGWVTVAVVTGYYYGPELLAAEGAASAGSAEAAALASSEAAAANALAAGNTTAYAGLETAALNSVPAGAYTGVTASSIPTQLNYSLGSGASGAPGITGTPAASTFQLGSPVNYELGSSVTQGVQQGLTPNLSSSFNPFAPTSMGGAQGLTVPSATGVGTVSAAGTFAPPTPFVPTPGSKDIFNPLNSRDGQPKEKEEKEPRDVTAAVSLLIDLLGERTKSTRGERSYAVGGAVEPSNPSATMGTAATTAISPGMVSATPQAAVTQQAAPTAGVTATEVAAPSKVDEEKITTDAAQAKLAASLTGVSAEQGTVSKEALAQAATVVPTETAVGKEQAAQGVVTEEMTTQGQLN